MRAWAHQGSFEPGTNLKAWLFTILRNHFYSELRKKKRSLEMQNDAAALEAGVQATQPSKLHLNDLVRELGRLTPDRSEEHTSELQSLMRISYAVVCLKKKKSTTHNHNITY